MPAGIEIVLGADFTDAQTAMNAFNQSVGQFVNQMAGLFAAAGANVEEFQKNLRSLIDVQKGLSVAIEGTNTSVTHTTNIINNVRGATRGLTNDFGVLSYTMTRTIHGFAELFVRPGQALLILSNDIPQLVTRVRELAVEQKALAAAGQPAISTMGLLAKAFDPLTFSIQIGLTALLRYGPELFKWATGMDKAAEEAKKLKEEQKELNSAFESGADSTFKQISKVQELSRAIFGNNTAEDKRKEKYNELIELYPQLETAVNTQIEQQKSIIANSPALLQHYDESARRVEILKDKINELTDALYKQAVAKGLASQIEDLGKKASEAVIKEDDLRKAAVAARVELKNMPKAPDLGAGTTEAGGLNAFRENQRIEAIKKDREATKALVENKLEQKKYKDQITSLVGKQDEYTQAVEKSILAQKGYKGQLEQTVKTEQARFNMMAPTDKGFEEQRKKVEAARKALKVYNTDVVASSGSKATKATKKQVDDLTKATEQYRGAIEAANRGWLEGRSSYAGMLKTELSAIDKFIVQVEGLHIPNEDTILGKIWGDRAAVVAAINKQSLADAMNAEFLKQQKELEKYMTKTYPTGKKAKLVTNYENPDDAVKRRDAVNALEKSGIDPTKYVNFSDPIEKQAKDADKALKKLREDFTKFANGIGGALSRPLENMVGAIFEGKDAMDSLVDSVKNLIEDLAKAVIKAGILSLLGKKDQVKAEGGFTGILGSLLGIGVKAAVPFLADGGITTRPTLAMIGEAGPEAVVPLNKMNAFQSQAQNLTLTTRWRGRDIEGSTNNFKNWKDY